MVLDILPEYWYRIPMRRLIALAVLAGLLVSVFVSFALAAPGRRHVKPTAAPVVSVTGSTPQEQKRVAKLESQLNFTQVAMIGYWQITILNSYDWDFMLRLYHIENTTTSAFTVMQQAHTFISEDYLTHFPDVRVRHTIAHEAGHLIAETTSEQKAEEIAAILEGRSAK